MQRKWYKQPQNGNLFIGKATFSVSKHFCSDLTAHYSKDWGGGGWGRWGGRGGSNPHSTTDLSEVSTHVQKTNLS